jgi:predicted P-loop ATPase
MASRTSARRKTSGFSSTTRIELSFDQMTGAVRINRGGEALDLTDPLAKSVWLEADELGLHADEGCFMAVLENTARQNSFHPLRDYLDVLEWDGRPRHDTWLTDYMGAEDTELHRAFGRKHLIGAVRRIQKPGSKYDTILIFQGIQGQGKSSFIRALSPSDEYFSDAIKIGADIQEIMEVCAGKWLIEIPELDGMGRKDAASVKAMLSRQTDEARMAYARYKTRVHRQFVMFGSVNDTHFLQDTTGNRRFWPVAVKPLEIAEKVVARLIENRDQLWAEAAHYERRGESVVLPKSLWDVAKAVQQARMVIDPWAEKLEDYLTIHPGFVQTEDIYSLLGVSSEKQSIVHHKRVNGILTNLGYRPSRPTVNGKRVRGYANGDDAESLD